MSARAVLALHPAVAVVLAAALPPFTTQLLVNSSLSLVEGAAAAAAAQVGEVGELAARLRPAPAQTARLAVSMLEATGKRPLELLVAPQGRVDLPRLLLLLVSHNPQLAQSLVVEVALRRFRQLLSLGVLGGARGVWGTKVALLRETAEAAEPATLGVAAVRAQMLVQLAAAAVGALAG